jgi:hypothetical protein
VGAEIDNVERWEWKGIGGFLESRPYQECPNCGEHELVIRRDPIYKRITSDLTRPHLAWGWIKWTFSWLLKPVPVLQWPHFPGTRKVGYRQYEYCYNCLHETDIEEVYDTE